MSSIFAINDLETEVRITIEAPRGEIVNAVIDLAKELELYQEGQSDDEIIELVAQATKNWWFEKVITQKSKQIEAYANKVAEDTKTLLTDQLNSSPLRGA
jgi:hypothetical protein